MDIKGTGQAVPLPDEKEYLSGQGWSVVKVLEGPTMQSLEGWATGYIGTGFTHIRIYSPDGVKWRLEARLPKENEDVIDPPVIDWDLDGAMDSKDIAQHIYYINNLAPSDKRAIDEAISNHQAIPSNISADPDQNLAANRYYNDLSLGRTAFTTTVWTLRENLTASTMADVEVSMTGTNMIWTAAQIGQLGVFSAVLASMQYLEGNAEASSNSDYVWGWLKTQVRVRQNIFSKVEVVTEWLFDLWPTYKYPQF